MTNWFTAARHTLLRVRASGAPLADRHLSGSAATRLLIVVEMGEASPDIKLGVPSEVARRQQRYRRFALPRFIHDDFESIVACNQCSWTSVPV
jgi:hypothetical protein